MERHSSKKQILFISGTFISNSCWDEWIIFFEREGYQCIAPAWPFKQAASEELRNRSADDPLASNTISILVDYFTDMVNDLPAKPILIGHSLGGLIVQLLIQKELGMAGVVIHSFPPKGIRGFRLSFLKAIWESMLLFRSGKKTYLISFRTWKRTIANGINCDLQKELYYKYAIPESTNILRETFKCKRKIDFKKSHVPLLFTSGSNDKLASTATIYSNYEKYEDNNSIVEFKEFNSNNHLAFAPIAWEREARFVLYWLNTLN